MTKNLVLIGHRGTGKTSVAKRISKILNKKIISIDNEIVKKTGISINEFIKNNSWEEFRKIEGEIILNLKDEKDLIIDCGGGIIGLDKNIENLKKNGIIFLLKAEPSVIIERIKNNNERPSLTEKPFTEEVEEILKKRIPLYKKASDYEINTGNKTFEEVSDEILKIINKNNTKICIPITIDTVDKALVDLKKAEEKADLIEFRIDFIKDIDENKLKKLLKNKTKEVIVTCRPKFEGGNFEGNEEERIQLLKKAIELNADYIDIEFNADKGIIEDIIKNKKTKEIEDFRGTQKSKISGVLETEGFHEFEKQKFFKHSKIIISYHNFKETPSLEELEKIYSKIKNLNPDLIKVVTPANSINDNFKIFELLENKKNLISFCMGIKGQISRVLAPKFNSNMTFASLEKNKESAPGQISIDEIKNEYNIDSINQDTKLLGVIGEFAENSKSRFMHNKMFKEKGINLIYHPLKLDKNELEEFINNFKKFDFIGAAVTVPHKETIIHFLDELDETAKDIGAVNTIVKDNGKLIGYNTDYYGAVKALKEKTQLENKKILIIGAGGAARAIVYGLKKENTSITIINRTAEKAQKLAEEFNVKADEFENMKELIKMNDIIINTTSVGMKPNVDQSIIKETDMEEGKIIMDIVYTPIKTKLIKYAQNANCEIITGERMLIYQAMKQFKLWTKQEPDFKIMEKAIMEKMNQGD